MVFYTYFFNTTPRSTSAEWLDNYLIISPDRNTSDTFFRVLHDNRTFEVPPQGPYTFTDLKRVSPSVWTYTISSEQDRAMPSYLNKLLGAAMTATNPTVWNGLIGKIKIIWMGNVNWPPVVQTPWTSWQQLPAQPGDDHDTLSGFSFFVRRRGYSNAYWYCEGGDISLSQQKRSRFVVTIHPGHRETLPIIATDKVKIQWMSPDSNKKSVDIKSDSGTLTVTTGRAKIIRFSSFMRKFSIGYGQSDHTNPYAGCTIRWSSVAAAGESFELCDGIPLEDDGDMSGDEY